MVVEIDTGVTTFAVATLASMFYSMLFIYFDEQLRLKKIRGNIMKNSKAEAEDEDDDQNEHEKPFDIQQLQCTEPSINQKGDEKENDNQNRKFQSEKPRPREEEEEKKGMEDDLQNGYINDEPEMFISGYRKAKISEINGVDCFGNEIERYSSLHKWKSDGSFKIYALYDLPDSFCGILWRCLFLTLLIGNLWLCIDVIYTAPVRYDMEGLAGWAIDNKHREYTIIGIANKVPHTTDTHGAAWFCYILYMITVIIAPILVSTILVIVWLLPINYKLHNMICHLLLPLQAWNAMDVFMLGCVAASIELEQVSQWILNTNFQCACGEGGIIDTLFNGVGCFSVKGNLTNGTILLLIFVTFEWIALLYTRNCISKTHKKYVKSQYHPVKL